MTRGRRARCPYCQSDNTISKGFRYTVTLGTRRLRRCKDCKRRFTSGTKQEIETIDLPAETSPAIPESI